MRHCKALIYNGKSVPPGILSLSVKPQEVMQIKLIPAVNLFVNLICKNNASFANDCIFLVWNKCSIGLFTPNQIGFNLNNVLVIE